MEAESTTPHQDPPPTDASGVPDSRSVPDSAENSDCPSSNQPSADPSPRAATGDDTENSADADYPDSTEDRNPEAPAELLDRQDLITADKIGDTVFSKHWLFTTLMRLIQVVDAETESKECTVTEAGVDIGESLQDELCKLWDMSMNSEVVTFLQEFKAVDIFTGVVAKSKAPRATEICIGIFGNMACNDDASKEMAANKKLVEIVLLLLSDPDAPTLVETMRLLLTVVSNRTHCGPWIAAIKEKDTFLGDVMFILSSSTNNDLLRNTAMFIDKLLDLEDDLCSAFALPQLITAILEAVKQTGIQPNDAMEAYLHILQLLSTTEMGVTSLVANADEVCHVMLQYLVKICEDDIVIVEGYENAIASALSTLNVIITSSHEQQKYILQDFELVRCLLKILDVVFPKLHPEKSDSHRHHRRRHRSQRNRLSVSETSPDLNGSRMRSRTESVVSRQDSGDPGDEVLGLNNVIEIPRSAGTPRIDPEVEYDKTRSKILYEVLHGFAEDVIDILNVQEALEDTPRGLDYLDHQAPRYRIYHFIWALQQNPAGAVNNNANHNSQGQGDNQGHLEGQSDSQGQTEGHTDMESEDQNEGHSANQGQIEGQGQTNEGHPKVTALKHIAALYRLDRLERIIGDALHE